MKNLLRFLLIFWVLGFGFGVAYSQNKAPLVKQWDARFGSDSIEYLYAILQTKDGGYILGGVSLSDSSGDKSQNSRGSYDFWIVKADALGHKQWDKRFGGSGDDNLNSVQQTEDGGFIIGGSTINDSSGDVSETRRGNVDCWMVKTDSLGNKQWDKRFGGNSPDEIASLQQTPDGGYILGCTSSSDSSGDKTKRIKGSNDFWIIKTDSAGHKQWDKDYGGNLNDKLYCLQQTTDRGYILGGYSSSDSSGDKTQSNRGFGDFWIIKIDSAGKKQWDKRFGGASFDYLHSLQQTKDGGYILGGYTMSDSGGDVTQPRRGARDYWIVKTDAQGNKEWDKRFGGADVQDDFGYVMQTKDSGYLISGDSYSGISGDKTEANLSKEQIWIIKTDCAGNKVWDKTIFTGVNSRGHDEGGFGIQTKDGGYAVASYSFADTGGYKTQMSRGSWDFWIAKFADTSSTRDTVYLCKGLCDLAAPEITADRDTLCSGDSARICAPSGFAVYQWNVGGDNICLEARQAGNYYVTVTDANSCTAESNHIPVIVHPVPSVSIVVQGDTFASFNAVAYQWYKDGVPISDAASSIYIAHEEGAYSVAVTDSNGCEALSNPINYTGINSIEKDNIQIYPNPSSINHLQLLVSNNLIGSKVEVYDESGRLIQKYEIRSTKSEIEMNVAQGIYFLRISSPKANIIRKLIKL